MLITMTTSCIFNRFWMNFSFNKRTSQFIADKIGIYVIANYCISICFIIHDDDYTRSFTKVLLLLFVLFHEFAGLASNVDLIGFFYAEV